MTTTARDIITIDDTRFIFSTNFAGNPDNDRFGDSRRKANILIPDPEQAHALMDAGIRVRQTRPRPDDDPETFVPEYFVVGLLKYRNKTGQPVKFAPKVYLVCDGQEPLLLDEDSIDCLDRMRIKNVCVVLNPYEYDPDNHGVSLYIRTMYVEQDLDDPYAERYHQMSMTDMF